MLPRSESVTAPSPHRPTVSEMATSKPNPAPGTGGLPTSSLVDTRQTAAMLGVALSTFQTWCAAGPESGLMPVPYYRIGGRLKWRPAEVEAWIDSKREAA